MQSYNFFLTYTNESLELEENAQEATWKTAEENNIRKQDKEEVDTKINIFPCQNQNFISISRKIIVPLCSFSEKKMKCGCKIWARKSYYI